MTDDERARRDRLIANLQENYTWIPGVVALLNRLAEVERDSGLLAEIVSSHTVRTIRW